MEIQWNEITADNQEKLEKVLKFYDESFPIEVREPHDVFLKGVQYAADSFPNHFRFIVGVEGDQVVSFATGHYLAEVNAGFIVYIATNPLLRRNGVGSKTLKKIEELLHQDAVAAGKSALQSIVLETEIEEMVHTEAEKEDCIKRQRFFEKNHYKRYEEVHYLQPPLHGDEEGIPLYLFIKDLQINHLTKAEVDKLIQAIYREKYDRVNGIDQNILRRCLEKMEINER